MNEAQTKHLFDNRYGTGQSTIDAVLRATNILLSGRRLVVAGYGWCGRGIALRARGMGAHVIVTEVEPLRALEAVMDGYEVMPMARAAEIADIFITATGDKNVIGREEFARLKDGAILANAGHFNVELELPALRALAVSVREARPNVEEYTLGDGRRVYVLAEGRLVNLAAAEGHPAAVMDMSFANQALSAEYVAANAAELDRHVYDVPSEIDREIARLKLETLGVRIDTPHRGAGAVPVIVGRGDLKPDARTSPVTSARRRSSGSRRTGWCCSTSVGSPTWSRSSSAGRARTWRMRSACSPSAVLRRSAWQLPWATRSLPRSGRTSTRQPSRFWPRDRRPSTSRGRSTRCGHPGGIPRCSPNGRAPSIAREVERCEAMGEAAVELFEPGARPLTHCNTGALATAGHGSALGAIRSAHAAGRIAHVYVDETRPLYQGARLTAWELERAGIPHTVIVDGAAGALMRSEGLTHVVVGADRIAANGDVANKIGTYSLAVLAAHHSIPFVVVAPTSTIDAGTASGASIPVEERSSLEVSERFPARNPAFDVTPAELVTAIVSERGVHRPPYGFARERP